MLEELHSHRFVGGVGETRGAGGAVVFLLAAHVMVQMPLFAANSSAFGGVAARRLLPLRPPQQPEERGPETLAIYTHAVAEAEGEWKAECVSPASAFSFSFSSRGCQRRAASPCNEDRGHASSRGMAGAEMRSFP